MNGNKNIPLRRSCVRAKRAAVAAVLGAALLVATSVGVSAQTFTGFELLPGGADSGIRGLSADGSTAVGISGDRPFRWTRAGGMQDLGTLPGYAFSQVAVNADGSVIVGSYYVGVSRAFRWTSADGMQAPAFGALPGFESQLASGVSADGTVVVGLASASGFPNREHTVRWTNSGSPQDLAPTSVLCLPPSVSADGSAVAWSSGALDRPYRPFRWTSEGGTAGLALPVVPSGWSYVYVNGISADGSVIVGAGHRPDPYPSPRALRWTDGDVQDLGIPPGFRTSEALAVNSDGSVIGGRGDPVGINGHALLWHPVEGWVDLNTYLPSIGVDLTGWTLREVTGISADGHTIVGNGWGPEGSEGWIATLAGCTVDFNNDALVNSQDFFDYLNAFFTSDARADFNADGTVSSGDFFAFLDAFFAGCP